MKHRQGAERLRTFGLILAALIFVGGAGWWVGRESGSIQSAPITGNAPAERGAGGRDDAEDYLSGAVTLSLREDAPVRDFPSQSGGALLRTQAAGTLVTGRWVRGADPNARWLRLAGGGYVHGAAVDEGARATGSGPEPTQAPGDARTITLDIGNDGCEWGLDFAHYVREAQAVRDQLFATDPMTEGQSTTVRVPNRRWRGLTVTAVALHYESVSVYFAEAPDRVIAALRNAGVRVDADGGIPLEDDIPTASVSATMAEFTRYGRTEIGCGV